MTNAGCTHRGAVPGRPPLKGASPLHSPRSLLIRQNVDVEHHGRRDRRAREVATDQSTLYRAGQGASRLRYIVPSGPRPLSVNTRRHRCGLGGRTADIQLTVRRFFCDAVARRKRTFAEQVDGLTVRYGRRTPAVQRLLERVALAARTMRWWIQPVVATAATGHHIRDGLRGTGSSASGDVTMPIASSMEMGLRQAMTGLSHDTLRPAASVHSAERSPIRPKDPRRGRAPLVRAQVEGVKGLTHLLAVGRSVLRPGGSSTDSLQEAASPSTGRTGFKTWKSAGRARRPAGLRVGHLGRTAL